MLTILSNNHYLAVCDPPGDAIRFALSQQLSSPHAILTIRNDFGDEWELNEYIDLIEANTPIRIPEKDKLP